MLLAVVAFAAAMLAHIFLTDAWRDVWPHVLTDDGGVHSPWPFNERPTSERVVFYVEDPNDPIGRRYAGTAKWQSRVELIKPSDKLEMVVALEVEIPERDLALTLSIRRVADVGSAISHLVEIRFTNVIRAPVDAIARSLGILMKTDERSPGSELIGSIASVAPGVFLFGLSAIDRDRVLNLRLLRGRGWLDIPVIYGDGSRGILAVEKGASGTRAIEEAVGRWERT